MGYFTVSRATVLFLINYIAVEQLLSCRVQATNSSPLTTKNSFTSMIVEQQGSSSSSRRLENADNYYYDFNLEEYSVEDGHCFRSKVINDNDDDGNAYFYNGAYRAQFLRYTSFYMCENKDENNCKLYVIDLPTYLQTTTGYLTNYCTSCTNSCRRALQEDGDVVADCNTCSNQCKTFSNNQGNEYNAMNFLECKESYNDGELQYYSGPNCGSDGNLFIGQFYDNECTIKLNSDDSSSKFGLSYDLSTFEMIRSMNIDCSINTNTCQELAEESIYCYSAVFNEDEEDNGGFDISEEDEKLCKVAKQATRVYTYYKKPRKYHTKIAFVFCTICIGMFGFLSYTYFVRHTNREKVPLASLDSDGSDLKSSDLPVLA